MRLALGFGLCALGGWLNGRALGLADADDRTVKRVCIGTFVAQIGMMLLLT
jgi:hypothetical protein